MCTITKNEQFGSFEVTFEGKPSEAVREALKALRFRWNPKKSVWYGFTDADTLRKALDGENITESEPGEPKRKANATLPPLFQRCDFSKLPGYGTDNEIKQAARDMARANGSGYDKEVAKIMRKHLKENFPECKFSVRSGGAGWLNKVNIDLIASPYEAEGEEVKHIIKYLEAYFDVFDDDDGDYYADYGARHDLYGGVSVSYKYEQTEQTEETKKTVAQFEKDRAEAEQAAAKAAELARIEAEKQAEIDRIAFEKAEAERKRQIEKIEKSVIVEDIPEAEQHKRYGLGGIGKESTHAELVERLKEEPRILKSSRKVIFSDAELFDFFKNHFLADYSFLAGMGGTATDDDRVTDENMHLLNAAQIASVEWYSVECVEIYLNDELNYIVDPQGYNYARYVYIPSEKEYTEQTQQPKKRAFYLPEPLEKQVANVKGNLKTDEQVTIFRLDSWTLMTIETRGQLRNIEVKPYAQYTEALYAEIIPNGKRKPYNIIGQTAEIMIYKGELPTVPQDLKHRDVGFCMSEDLTSGINAKTYLNNIYDFYAEQNIYPIINNIQR